MIKNVLFILALFPAFAFSQNEAGIKVISRTLKGEITLRWAPNDPIAWQYANKEGYMVERFTIVRDGKVLEVPEKITLTPNGIAPKPLAEWETIAKADERAAVAAQALYGSTFELKQNSKDMIQIINKAKESEMRFGIALFCADQSIEIADMMGLKFSDKDAKADEKYLYKVYTKVLPSKMKIDTGIVFVDGGKLTVMPKPTGLKAEFFDKAVRISWNKLYYESFYSNYVIERSDDDGKTFKALNDNPFLNTTPTEEGNNSMIWYLDSIPENNKKYIFRIKGKSYFGDFGPNSDPVEGMGIAKPTSLPVISEGKVIPEGKVTIKWTFPETSNAAIKGFKISVADKLNGIYKEVTKDYLKSDQREFLYQNPGIANYFKVKVYDLEDNEYSSLPYLVQLRDNTPPSVPSGLYGKVDTTGIVRLQWKANKEMDLLGYRVYRANSSNDEFTQVTKSPVSDTTFTDTINIKTLTKNVYYKIVALDNHFNPSKLSEATLLKRPDIIPPVAPTFKNYSISDTSVFFEWHPSPSDDVVKVVLLRRENGQDKWTEVKSFDNSSSSWQDISLNKGITYLYALKAIDDSQNNSEISSSLEVKLVNNKSRQAITKIKNDVDRTKKQVILKWEYPEDGVERFLIYKALEGQPLRLYKTVSGDTFEITDTNLSIDTKYKYSIRAKFRDGGSSPFSKEVQVHY